MASAPGRPVATLVLPLLRQRDEWLATCVESALEQTVPCEVIVVTDRRTPRNNLDVLARIDPSGRRVQVRCRPEGVRFAGALEIGIAAASCDRVGFVLTDDWIEPDAVEACLRHDADIVSSSARAWAADGRHPLDAASRIRTSAGLAACPDHESRARLLGHFMLLSREAVRRAGGVDTTVGDSPGVDDYHLLWTMLEHGATARIVERPLYNFRDHDGERLTNRRPLQMWATMLRILTRHGLRGEAREALLLSHTRWFGGPLADRIDPRTQHERWIQRPGALEREGRSSALLVRCARLATSPAALEVHARRIARRSRIPISAALAALTEAALTGVLVRAHDLRTAAPSTRRSSARAATGVVPTTIAVMACDRPDLVERSLGELSEHLHAHGRRADTLVLDDSRDPGHRHAIARRCARGSASHVDRTDKDHLCAELRGLGADLELALGDPLGSGYTLGANLNALLLRTAGQVVLSIDEDVRPIAFAAPGHDGPARTCSGIPAIERFYAHDEEARAWQRPMDVLGAHGRWLGAPTGEARVVATWMGVCGSIGFANPTPRVLASDDERLRRDPHRLRAVLQRPRALRCPPTVTLNRGAGFTSSTIALDNRNLLPPFFPVGRGIDLLWGVVTGLCLPEARFAFLPVGLAHARETPTRTPSVDAPLWAIVSDAVVRAAMGVHDRSPALRMQAIGAGLRREADRGPDDLAQRVAALNARSRSIELRTWTSRLARAPEASSAWRDAVAARIRLLEGASPQASVPAEIRRLTDEGAPGWRLTAALLGQYGELLAAWPAIVQRVGALRRSA